MNRLGMGKIALGVVALLIWTSGMAETPAQVRVEAQPQTPVVASGVTTLTSQTDKLSYTIGVDLQNNFKRQGFEINPQALFQGLQDAHNEGQLKMTREQMAQTLENFQKQLVAKRLKQFNEKALANQKKGEAFLAENKKKKGVVTLPSGLQYRVIKSGSGQKPTEKSNVTVDYVGRTIDGKVFDSSKKIGKPATFQVGHVIPGWTEALQLMKEGAKWEVFVPAKLAYGARGLGGPIGPNETLIFTIHLVKVKE